MPLEGVEAVWLDYAPGARSKKFLKSLSAISAAGEFLWTVSDEGRTVECLEPHRDGYRLRHQYRLDDLFPGLPGLPDRQEADVESLDCDGTLLWICGSHSRVREDGERPGAVSSRISRRRSRNLLGTVRIEEGGGALDAASARALPVAGQGSLRRRLREDRYLAPSMDLPARENGLDVEGLAVTADRAFLGLRGPVIANLAIVVEAVRSDRAVLRRSSPTLHFLDLKGAGVRDLARDGSSLLVLSGPITTGDGPFALYAWQPRYSPRAHRPTKLWTWPGSGDHPEGMCVLERAGRRGLLVVYDSADERRIDGSRYRADWIPLSGPDA